MPLLPITIPPEEEELLGSWIYRLSNANCFDTPDLFLETFIRPQGRYRYIKYNDDYDFLELYKALQPDIPIVELFTQTASYPGLAPFIPSGQQTRRLNSVFRKPFGPSELFPSHSTLTPELRCCEKCRHEDLERSGFWYLRRSHQFPGVKVCHKHGCLLKVFQGHIGHEFNDDAPWEYTKPNASYDIMQGYAAFVRDILYAAPDTDLVGTKYVIRQALMQNGYSKKGAGHKALSADIQQSEMTGLFQMDIDHFLKVNLASTNYTSVVDTIALAFFLFRTADQFINTLPLPSRPDLSQHPDFKDYQLLNQSRNSLLQLRHKCDTEFCITADGFLDGWGCPKCDSSRAARDIFKTLIAHTGGGAYIAQSEFAGLNTPIDILHCSCGRTSRISPRGFFYERVRCKCEGQQRKENLLKRLKESDEFELVEYSSHNDHLFLRHLRCNQTFECGYDYFMADMRCPKCQSGVRSGLKKTMDLAEFKRRMIDIVGDEYTLESTSFVEKGTRVVIRHNKCGTSHPYTIWGFLKGRRCPSCRVVYSAENKPELIAFLSNNEYEMVEINNCGICTLKNRLNNSEYHMDFHYVLQELTRPTPSSVLPCLNPVREIEKFVPTHLYYNEELLAYLKKTYAKNDAFFLDELDRWCSDKQRVKRAVKKLSNAGTIQRIQAGVYKWADSEITHESIIFQRYIRHQDKQIGYFYGESFAYRLGLISKKPTRTYIVTNKEANTHGRKRTYLGHQLHIRGPKNPVTDENWRILQLLDLLPNLSKYTKLNDEQTNDILCHYVHDTELTYAQCIPYLSLYPDWVDTKIHALTTSHDQEIL